jgi:hypothetical protein
MVYVPAEGMGDVGGVHVALALPLLTVDEVTEPIVVVPLLIVNVTVPAVTVGAPVAVGVTVAESVTDVPP